MSLNNDVIYLILKHANIIVNKSTLMLNNSKERLDKLQKLKA